MTLTELRYLVALDSERHFGHAAERSFVSQPTLSVAIRKLERDLGVLLFERSRGEATPTPTGKRIIEQARRVLDEAAKIENMAQEGQDELNGPLRLGAIYTVGPYLLPDLIPTLRETAPQMPLVIEENYTDNLARQLRQNELDVILIALPFELAGVDTWPVYDEPFDVVLPKDHPWAAQDTIDAERLATENLLLLGPGHCFRDQVIAACPNCDLHEHDAPQPLTGSSLETIRHMVASGLGITVLPRSSTESRHGDNPLLVMRPFKRPPSRTIALVWRRSFPRPAAIRALHSAVTKSGLRGVTMVDVEPLHA